MSKAGSVVLPADTGLPAGITFPHVKKDREVVRFYGASNRAVLAAPLTIMGSGDTKVRNQILFAVFDEETHPYDWAVDYGFCKATVPEDPVIASQSYRDGAGNTRQFHDCLQYSVKGSVYAYPSTDGTIEIGKKTYYNPVFISGPGTVTGTIPEGRCPDRWVEGAYHPTRCDWTYILVAVKRLNMNYISIKYRSQHVYTTVTPNKTYTQVTASNWDTPEDNLRWSDRKIVGSYRSALIPKRLVDNQCIYSDILYDWLRDETEELYPFGELSLKAAESARRLDINMLAYIRGIRDIAGLATTMVKPLYSTDLKSTVHNLAGLYLGKHYGARLQNRFSEQIADAIDQIDFMHSTQTIGAYNNGVIRGYDFEQRLTAVIGSCDDNILHAVDSMDDAITQLCKNRIERTGLEIDILPSPENIWDLIPYSFVVDWFVPIGDMLSRHETSEYITTLPVHRVFLTQKHTSSVNKVEQFGNTTLQYNLHYKYYNRRCVSTLPYPSMHVDRPQGGLQRHWFEGTALLLQAITR